MENKAENSQENVVIDREFIKEQRKIRNKARRQAIQLEKRRIRELEHFNNKLKPSNVISQEFLDKYNNLTINNDAKPTKRDQQNVLKVDDFIASPPEPTTSQNCQYKCDPPMRFKGKHSDKEHKVHLSSHKKQIIENQTHKLATIKIDYCTNIITESLETAIESLLQRLVQFQNNKFEREPEKAQQKPRYKIGFHEIKKYLLANRLKLLIIAKDLNIFSKDDHLYQMITELIGIATEQNVPYVFAMKRRKLGKITLKIQAVSCIGILSCESTYEQYKLVLELISILKL